MSIKELLIFFAVCSVTLVMAHTMQKAWLETNLYQMRSK